MSSRTRRSTRQGPRAHRPHRSETPDAILEAAVTAIVSSIRREGVGLASVADPLEAELYASGILAMWHADALQDVEPLEILGVAVIRRLAGRPHPDALAVLLAIAAIAPPPHGSSLPRACAGHTPSAAAARRRMRRGSPRRCPCGAHRLRRTWRAGVLRGEAAGARVHWWSPTFPAARLVRCAGNSAAQSGDGDAGPPPRRGSGRSDRSIFGASSLRSRCGRSPPAMPAYGETRFESKWTQFRPVRPPPLQGVVDARPCATATGWISYS